MYRCVHMRVGTYRVQSKASGTLELQACAYRGPKFDCQHPSLTAAPSLQPRYVLPEITKTLLYSFAMNLYILACD